MTFSTTDDDPSCENLENYRWSFWKLHCSLYRIVRSGFDT